jgi:hypothetical protein
MRTVALKKHQGSTKEAPKKHQRSAKEDESRRQAMNLRGAIIP